MDGSSGCDYKSYELEFFDDLITERLNPDNKSGSTDNSFFLECQVQVSGEKKLLLKKLICTTISFNDEGKARCYIHNRQSRICYLADETTLYLKAFQAESNPLYFRLLCQVEKILIDILQFLSQQFSQYFDFNQKAPNTIKENTVNQFSKRLTVLLETVNGQGERLFQLTVTSIQELAKKKEASFYSLNYFGRLMEKLEEIDFSQADWAGTLKTELLNMNFNTALFLEYLTNEIQSKIELEETKGQKRHLFLIYLKKYNRMEILENPLNPKAEPICLQVTSWITEELEVLEQVNRSETGSDDDTNSKLDKIKTSLSVPQLALFTRLQIEERIFSNEKAKTLRAVAAMYSTPIAKDISFGSLKLQYYTFDTGTKEAVRCRLIDMLNRLNQGI